MTERPWTGGEWTAAQDADWIEDERVLRENWVVHSGEADPVMCYEVADVWTKNPQADAELIALAPRMAEALLELDRLAEEQRVKMKGTAYVGYGFTTARVRLMVKKLKQIGAENG